SMGRDRCGVEGGAHWYPWTGYTRVEHRPEMGSHSFVCRHHHLVLRRGVGFSPHGVWLDLQLGFLHATTPALPGRSHLERRLLRRKTQRGPPAYVWAVGEARGIARVRLPSLARPAAAGGGCAACGPADGRPRHVLFADRGRRRRARPASAALPDPRGSVCHGLWHPGCSGCRPAPCVELDSRNHGLRRKNRARTVRLTELTSTPEHPRPRLARGQ